MMNEDIRKAIDNNLSGEVSKMLQRTLAQGEQDAETVENLKIRCKEQDETIKACRVLDRDAAFNESKRRELESRERELELKEARVNVRAEMSEGFMNQYNFMWAQAFSSPEGKKLAFNFFGSIDGYNDANGMYQQPRGVNVSGDITEVPDNE